MDGWMDAIHILHLLGGLLSVCLEQQSNVCGVV